MIRSVELSHVVEYTVVPFLKVQELSRLPLKVSSDSPQGGRTDQDIFHHSIRCILLYNHALQTQKCRCNLSKGIQWFLYSQLGCNAEAYMDDVVVKTQEEEGLISDLAVTFDHLRKFKMKLNPEKCTFGVPSGKLLGYMVSQCGIDPNPEKVLAIAKMKPPDSLHDVQKLTRCMVALSRFIL
jgi:hypothetical protein